MNKRPLESTFAARQAMRRFIRIGRKHLPPATHQTVFGRVHCLLGRHDMRPVPPAKKNWPFNPYFRIATFCRRCGKKGVVDSEIGSKTYKFRRYDPLPSHKPLKEGQDIKVSRLTYRDIVRIEDTP